MAGWFGPTGNCSCCNCDCPRCTLTADECTVYWNCCIGDSEITLTSDAGEDFGVVENVGSVSSVAGAVYTLVATQDGCPSVTKTVTASNDCPCPAGCRTGRVIGARPTATITVTHFGSASLTSPLILGSNCDYTIVDYWDYSALNHTATFPVKVGTYNYLGNECSLEYIEPTEYFLASVTNTRELHSPFGIVTSTVTFDVYAVISSTLNSILSLNEGHPFRLKYIMTARTRATNPCLSGSPLVYASGDGALVNIGDVFFSSHYGSDSTAAIIGGARTGHYPWCDESISASVASYEFSGFAFLPSAIRGVYQWESIA